MNNVLYEACRLSQEQWINSFLPLEEHEFSARHEKKMNALFSRIRNNKYHKLTKNAIRAIIIAAIILSLAITAFAIEIVKAYKTYNINVGTFYKSSNPNNTMLNESLNVGYMPKEYILVKDISLPKAIAKEYKSEKGDRIIIEKYVLVSESLINTEQSDYEEIHLNGIKYIYYTFRDYNCIIWNNSKYTYIINGHLPKDELLQVALSTS